MGLDCIPKPCTCGLHRRNQHAPQGLTHPPDEPCPFAAEKFPEAPLGTCCSLRGKVAARELEALGEDRLRAAMHEDMTAENALAFADRLRESADRLEREHAHDAEKPKGAGWNGTWDPSKPGWRWETYSTFEEALASVREAARWYSMVGAMGFGVHAWY